MTNIIIPQTNSTQILTGNNGVTTEATFTANDLGGAYWSRTGVGLSGANYDPSGEAAFEAEFSNSVEDVQFTLFDIDQASGSWDDQVRIEAFDPAGNPIPITYTTTGTGHVIESDGSNGVLQIEASNNSGDNQSSIIVSIAGPVGSFKIYYEDGSNTTNDNGVINLESMSFTNAIERDGTVSGGSGDDVIDGSYGGDPNGDVVDNDDAILPGDTGNDDLIEANGGNDSVLAGDGNDEVYGGTGNDTIDGGVGNDTLFGDSGNDTLEGGTGNDTMYGGEGNDTIFAGADDDAIYGGDAQDTILVGNDDGTDIIVGGEGGTDFDTIDFSGVTDSGGADGVTITYDGDESADYSVGATGSNGTFDEIESIIGTDNADMIDATLDSAGFSADAGAGNDVITGGTGDDDITAGTGDDTISLNDNFGDDTIDGGTNAGDTDVLDGSDLTQDVTLDLTAPETGTLSNGTDTTTFGEIEEFVLGSGDDSVTGSTGDDIVDLGQGTDTIDAGAGDDQINLGEDSPGNPDEDPDVIVFSDGDGNDTVTNFDAPIDNGDGTFTGVDTLDVTALNDASGTPVNTNDVEVSDDGSGNAVLTFPNGESITLDGIPPADADNPLYLNAIGIPSPAPDGIVTGTSGDNVIDGSYDGDLEGDFVDNSDALLAGEAPEDDIIVALGGDDSVTAGLGDDDIYGGDGSDTIDAGAGDDTVYGDTPGGDWYYEYYDLDPTGNPQSLTQAGFNVDNGYYEGTPTETGYTDSLNPAAIDSTDDYALKFTTTLTIETAGDYTFALNSDDGSRMYIDGVEVVDFDGHHGTATNPVTGAPIPLSEGQHTIEIIFYENNGGNVLNAYIDGPDTGDVQTTLTGYDGVGSATGDDVITGGTGNDALFGGTGDDEFHVAEADDTDTITGGEDTDGNDTDTVSFDTVGNTDSVDVTFTGDEAAAYQVGTSGSDGTFTEIERVVGSDNDDTVDLSADTSGITVEGGAGDDLITSGLGNDDIDGDTGDDTIALNDNFGTDTIAGGEDAGNADVDALDATGVTTDTTLNLTAAETGTLTDGTNTATLAEIEQFFLGSGDDTATGSAGDDYIDLGQGDDTINAGAGDDVIAGGTGNDEVILTNGFGDDTITGGEDTGNGDVDILNATATTTDTVLNLSAPETGTLTDGTDTANLAEIEQFFLGSGDDSATGSAGDDFIDLGAGADTINAGGGDDVIAAGTGDDEVILTNGFGNDTITGGEDAGDGDVDILDASAVTVDTVLDLTAPETGTITDGTDTADLAEIEEFYLGSGDDSATGSTGDDVIDLGAGDDTINAGAGDDVIAGGTGDDEVILTNGFGNDTITGGEDAGNGDVDILDASAVTVDTVLDLTAPETGTLTDGTDTADLADIEEFVLGSGDDSATGSAGDDTIDLGAGDDSINAGQGDDNITAGTGDDTISIGDDFGNDNIDAGEDVGNGDVDVLDGSALTDDVTVTLTGDEVGTISDGTDTLNFANVEEIVTGSGDDIIVGGSGNDSVSTGAGDDTISGGEGADTFDAGDGDDTITFAEGDSIDGGDGNDTFTLEDLGEPTDGVITIVGGDGDEDPVDPVAGTGGDILRLGDLADMSTLTQTSNGINASGNETFSGSVTLDDGTTLNFSGIEQVICFTPGTNIATPNGSRPIETLRVGDLVVTRDHGMQPIRWIQQRTVPAMEKFAPIRLRPGVVTGLERDLLVSPQHRMLFQGYRAELLFGESEVLMPATHLIDDKMVTREEGGFVTYIHMMFDEHEVVYAEGAASESFHPGEIGLTGVSDAAREELFSLFPQLRSDPKGYGRTARRALKKHESQMLRTK
jgi:Ca2+-binding RTX toxin-like protein